MTQKTAPRNRSDRFYNDLLLTCRYHGRVKIFSERRYCGSWASGQRRSQDTRTLGVFNVTDEAILVFQFIIGQRRNFKATAYRSRGLRLAKKPNRIMIKQLLLLCLCKVTTLENFKRRVFSPFAMGKIRREKDLVFTYQLE